MSSCSKGSNACGDVALLSRLCYRNEASCPKLSVSVHIITLATPPRKMSSTPHLTLCVQGSRSKETRRNQYDFKFWASYTYVHRTHPRHEQWSRRPPTARRGQDFQYTCPSLFFTPLSVDNLYCSMLLPQSLRRYFVLPHESKSEQIQSIAHGMN